MIKKEVKEYKRGNSHTYRINIAKQDKLTGEVSILEVDEYKSLINQINNKDETLAKQDKEIKKLYSKIDNHEKDNQTIIESNDDLQQKIELLDLEHDHFEKRNDKLIKENTELLRQNKYLKKELENTEDMLNKFNTLIKDLQKQQDKTINELNQQHHETLKEISQQQDKTIENINTKHHNQLKKVYDKFNEDLTKYVAVNQLQNTALKQILELGFIDIIRNKHKKIAKDQIKLLDDKPVYELTKKE